MDTEHHKHSARGEWHADCDDCEAEAVAVDWFMAVRKYGLATANKMFP